MKIDYWKITVKAGGSQMTLTEQVFRKMGFSVKRGSVSGWYYWIDSNGVEFDLATGLFDDERINETAVIKILPPINSQWEVCAKYLVPFMREKDFSYSVGGETDRLGLYFTWYGPQGVAGQVEIKDYNISKSACKAFMEVELT